MSSYSYGWENKNCEMLLPFVCEVLAGDEAPTTLEPPTQPPLIPCQVSCIYQNLLNDLISISFSNLTIVELKIAYFHLVLFIFFFYRVVLAMIGFKDLKV